MRIAVLGATGLVGSVLMRLLGQGQWERHDVIPYASGRGGSERRVRRGTLQLPVRPLPDRVPEGFDAAFCALPSRAAREVVPAWTGEGVRVIDKSSLFRMEPGVPLVVPEVNGPLLDDHDGFLVATPNCSTTQLAVAVAPLRDAFGLERLSVATYQAVSGAGAGALEAWRAEGGGVRGADSPFHAPMHENVLPAIGSPDAEGHFTEEAKVARELPKILGGKPFPVACTAVRVPVETGHGEAVELTAGRELVLDEVREVLEGAPGLTLVRDPLGPVTPLDAAGRDDVLVGRVRLHPTDPRTLLLWVAADNLRKGAAVNALQILAGHLSEVRAGRPGARSGRRLPAWTARRCAAQHQRTGPRGASAPAWVPVWTSNLPAIPAAPARALATPAGGGGSERFQLSAATASSSSV
jgi:aspartate-semialdehyde dehydrogenase